MVKKITLLFAVLAFASSSSVALACDKHKGDKSDKDAAAESSFSSFEVAGTGCNGGKKSCDKDKSDA